MEEKIKDSEPTYQPCPFMLQQDMVPSMMYYQQQMYMQKQHQMLMQMKQPMDYTGMMGQMDESMSNPTERDVNEDSLGRQHGHGGGGGGGFGHGGGGFGHGGGHFGDFDFFPFYPYAFYPYPYPYYDYPYPTPY